MNSACKSVFFQRGGRSQPKLTAIKSKNDKSSLSQRRRACSDAIFLVQTRSVWVFSVFSAPLANHAKGVMSERETGSQEFRFSIPFIPFIPVNNDFETKHFGFQQTLVLQICNSVPLQGIVSV
jgi:hypothetical protein